MPTNLGIYSIRSAKTNPTLNKILVAGRNGMTVRAMPSLSALPSDPCGEHKVRIIGKGGWQYQIPVREFSHLISVGKKIV